MEQNKLGFRRRVCGLHTVVLLLSLTAFAAGQEVVFKLDPEHSTVTFTLGDVLHTVHGTFQLKQGSLRLDPISGKLSGEIVADAKSGDSGSGMRDRKMNREVLESDRYPEILFRPDHVEGSVLVAGKSSVRVHGIFTIHGSDHELTVPAELETFPDHWNATLHFAVPYAKWGMKNPSTMFLRVSESVNIDLTTTGILAHP
ncbi:MAG TPA: YceI family protein [Candidatus Acidoferrum sp.]|nr:YceI family protein [Candidatus Acidoferrum sp.]